MEKVSQALPSPSREMVGEARVRGDDEIPWNIFHTPAV
jgi:hypothetical protein